MLNGKNVMLIALALLLVTFVTGCDKKSDKPVLNRTSYVYLNVDLESKVTVIQLVEERQGDLASSQIILRNNTMKAITVYVRARYFDATGREVPSTFSQWTPVVIEGRASRPASAVAPNTTVTRIMFEINAEHKDPEPSPKAR